MANYSGLWDRHYLTPYAQLEAATGEDTNTATFNSTSKRMLSKLMRHKGTRPLARIMIALTGAAAGGSASETRTRVDAVAANGNPLSNGGLIPIETQSLINRATTAADESLIESLLDGSFGPSLVAGYPADAAGNGGGGKVGRF
jgi:hypothetical protein